MITDPVIRETQRAAFAALREMDDELELPGELPAEIEGDDEAADEVDVWKPKLNRVQLRRIRNAAKRKSRLTRVGRRQRTGGVK